MSLRNRELVFLIPALILTTLGFALVYTQKSSALTLTSLTYGALFLVLFLIAWGSVGSNGDLYWEFGVTSVSREGVGNYMIEIDASAVGVTALIPIAIAEVESQPDTAAEARIVSINQTAYNIFRVYINNGSWAPVDNDFVFMVTAR